MANNAATSNNSAVNLPAPSLAVHALMANISQLNGFLPRDDKPKGRKLYNFEQPNPLLLADDPMVDFFNREIDMGHPDQDYRTIGKVIFFRNHTLTPDEIRHFCSSKKMLSRSPNWEIHKANMGNAKDDFQHQTFKAYLEGLAGTISLVGGMEVLSNLSSHERMVFYNGLVAMNPLAMAHVVLRILASSLDLDNLFAAYDPLRAKWQNKIRLETVWAIEDVFSLRFMSTTKADKDLCFDKWRDMPRDLAFVSMNLGGLGEVPVNASGTLSRVARKGKRA
ncbi:uncharacterized protein KY384_002310 [Bacidia gigantensis]|uniref:uncharacterized protein n=1 Tax=Bacidia gigantensis TaxID=2732470 RepID=UPI001D04C980|nr:uncharacterized protein KY384_002310 [Bacidia gigantensis]KAG8532433.1 hypothetical protein KY384_002310 [Bacidia gigantensis]